MIGFCKLIKNLKVMPSGFYAVKVGRRCGIFNTWAECEDQVKGYPNAKYKKFSRKIEAENFISGEVNASKKRKFGDRNSFTSKKRKLEKPQTLEETDKALCSDRSVVYTDGCCHNNGKANANAGIGVYWGEDHPDNLSEKLIGRQSNNRAEIMAVVRALEQAKEKGIKHLEVRTDSSFLINCMTKWISKWKSRGWLLANGNPVINREELEKLDSTQQGIKVHVRGHQGIHGNECADQLANEGARK